MLLNNFSIEMQLSETELRHFQCISPHTKAIHWKLENNFTQNLKKCNGRTLKENLQPKYLDAIASPSTYPLPENFSDAD